MTTQPNYVSGEIIKIKYEDKDFELIVLDPNGRGNGKPTLGVRLELASALCGVPINTFNNWKTRTPTEIDLRDYVNLLPNQSLESISQFPQIYNGTSLKLPSGKYFKLFNWNSDFLSIEVSDFAEIIRDVLKRPGKIRETTLHKIIDFITWFAAKGIYAAAYSQMCKIIKTSQHTL
jgi:hypothetical protein